MQATKTTSEGNNSEGRNPHLPTSQPAARRICWRLAQQQVVVAGTVEQQGHIGSAAMLPIAVAADLLQARVAQHVDGDGSVQHMCGHRQLGLACVQ